MRTFFHSIFSLGNEIPTEDAVDLMVLSVGQVILIFFITGVFFSFVLLIFFCELVHHQAKSTIAYKTKHKKRQRLVRKSHYRNRLPQDLLRYPDDYPIIVYPPNKSRYFLQEIDLNNY